MKLFAAICASALALAGTGTSNATTYRPAGTYVYQGPATVTASNGISLNCILKLTIDVPVTPGDPTGAGNSATAKPVLSAGNTFCPVMTFDGAPYPVSFDGFNLLLSGVILSPLSGRCNGPISAAWHSDTGTIDLNSSIPDFYGSSSPCKIVGHLLKVGPAPFTITNP